MKSQSPKKRHNRQRTKHRAHSTVYSSLPSANINMGAMNVYAEVRGKYSRNANNTVNNLVQASGIVSRPSTSGSLMNYSRRSFGEDRKKDSFKEDRTKEGRNEEEVEKAKRPLNSEERLVIKTRRHREKDSVSEARSSVDGEKRNKNKDKGGNKNKDEDEEKIGSDQEGLGEANEDLENQSGSESELEKEKEKEEADRVTEVSFKTTSSQRRYIEELEQMLREERIRRIKAEGELERLSSRKSHKRQ